MAKKIKKGDIIPAQNIKTGVGRNGAYCCIPVGEKQNKISVWVANTDINVAEGDELMVKDILDVARSNSQFNGKWYNQVNISIIAEKTSSAPLDPSLLGGIPEIGADDLPF